jgi:hypothetical protein
VLKEPLAGPDMEGVCRKSPHTQFIEKMPGLRLRSSEAPNFWARDSLEQDVLLKRGCVGGRLNLKQCLKDEIQMEFKSA